MKLSKIKIEHLANEIMDFLKQQGLDNDVYIYFNGKRMNNKVVEEGFNPRDYFTYIGDILTMSFEGSFNSVINYYLDSSYCNIVMTKLDAILDKYGVYYELGNSWNLTLFYK